MKLNLLILLSLFSTAAFAGSIFKPQFELVKSSENWETKLSCETFVNYHPPQCMDENVTCTSHQVSSQQVNYEVCTEYGTVVKYATNMEESIYVEVDCKARGFSISKAHARLKVFDNSKGSYYGTKPMYFYKEFSSADSCSTFKNNINNIDSRFTIIELNFQDQTFITK
jgi:hypothetical protein